LGLFEVDLWRLAIWEIAEGGRAILRVTTLRRAVLLMEQVTPMDDEPEQKNRSGQKSSTAV